MPCYDAQRQGHTEYVYETGISPHDLNKAKNRIAWLESALCATFNELDRREIASSVAREASRNGLIDLMGFWSQHRDEDENRLAKALHAFSKDEQAILKQLLKE